MFVMEELSNCLIGFSDAASLNRYTKPNFVSDGSLIITQGRHPVVEKLLENNHFVPNNTSLHTAENQLLLITGPNMAGKSVYMRQVALITLMAQIGSFVPANKAEITPVDKIFVRSGAADMISAGLSTFMVEMVETAYILQHATKNSLIIMDEIGRGTSTYDGISIAWAIAEHIVKSTRLQTKTLFATHYHELQKLEEEYSGKIKNYHMAIHQDEGRPVFLHTIKEGGAAHSFGVAVAKLAGIPEEVTQNAENMLRLLEARSKDAAFSTPSLASSVDKQQLSFVFSNEEDQVIKELQELDIHQMTPLQALNKLSELKNKIKLVQNVENTFIKAD